MSTVMGCKAYTPRVDGFQIRDVVYFGRPPKSEPIKYDIVKWYKLDEPIEVIDSRTGEKKMQDEFCYSVAFLEWNEHEPCFELRGVGIRLLESGLTQAATDMILDFCEKKAKELENEEWSEY